jgi:glycosyltransferase involved in cell wall biosynthesis
MTELNQLRRFSETHGSTQRLAQNGAVPLVSVIIPCYNLARFLPGAIDSVLAQTRAPLEVIVVDDGSTDNTSEIASRYRSIRYFRQTNQGVSRARNFGFFASNGAYVIFLDADDQLTPNAVEAHLDCFDAHTEAGFVVGDIDQISENGLYKYSPRWPVLTSNFYEELLKANHVANTIAVMFRRSVIEQLGGFDTSGDGAEDYEILLRAARSFSSAHHRTVVALYRRYPTSRSQQGLRLLRAMRRIMRAQRVLVRGNARLQAACRKGENYWRDIFGVIAIKETARHFRRGDLLRATKVFAGLVWHVRGRLLLVPWNKRHELLGIARTHFRSGPERECRLP